MVKVSNLKTEDLSPQALQALLTAIDADIHPMAGPLMKMALFTGMRRGELFSLRWKDVDFERGFIAIVDPKGGQDVKIPLNEGPGRSCSHFRGSRSIASPGAAGKEELKLPRP